MIFKIWNLLSYRICELIRHVESPETQVWAAVVTCNTCMFDEKVISLS